MESSRDRDDLTVYKSKPIDDLVQVIVNQKAELHSCRQQVEHLQRKLSEYREKEDSLSDSSGSHRGPLIRAKSDPISGQTKRNSNPEVFLFPEAKTEHFQNKEPIPVSNLNQFTPPGNNVQAFTITNQVDIGNEPDTSLNLRSNIPASWLDPNIAIQGCPGVSEQYFKNVLNELVKTKKYLNNLLMQKHGPDRTVEMNNMRHELQQLEFTKQHLQRELGEMKEENSNLKLKLASTRTGKDTSFELEGTFMMGLSEGTQTDQALDVIQVLTNQLKKMGVEKQMLDREHKKILYTANNLMEENHALKEELNELQSSQKNLSTQVMSLSTLLQEQHKKNKSLEDGHRSKSSEAKELSEKLCILRQKYEELMEEKNAMEKNVALMSSRMRHHHQTRPITQPGQSIPGRFHSHDKTHLHSPSQGDSSKNTNSYTGSTSHSLKHKTHSSDQEQTGPRLIIPDPSQRRTSSSNQNSPLNNLSPREPEERKVLNLPSHLAHIVPSQDYECPTCLQTFDTETSYLTHLEKCLE